MYLLASGWIKPETPTKTFLLFSLFLLSFISKKKRKKCVFSFFMDSIVGMWNLAYIRKDSGNTSRNKTQSAPWDSEGLTSNGTRHLATLISVICEFGIGRCLFKEPRSGSQCSFPFNRAIFVSDHPFDWTSADTKGILHPGDWDKMEKSVGTAGLRNPIRNLPPPTYSFFIYCNHRQKC